MDNKTEEKNKKREQILRKIRLVNNEVIIAKACAILDRYLVENHRNKTPERVFILSLIYQLSQPADIDTIHRLVEECFGHISSTTVYYTLQLLSDVRLVRRIELIENGPAFYEKTLEVAPHGYTVCRVCGAIKIIPLDNIRREASMQVPGGFQIDDVSLIIKGTCRSCTRKRQKERPKTTKTTKKKLT